MTTCAFSKILQGWRLGRTKRDSNKDDEEKAVESGAANMPSSRLSPSSEDPLARYQTNDDYIPEVASDPNGSPPPRQSTETNHTDDLPQVHQIKKKKLHFWEGGVRTRHHKLVRFIGRCGFIAKGMVYGIIGVLIATTITGTYTPNGSGGNESPQGVFLLLGGIPAVGRSVLVAMAVGLATYLFWRFWEGITGQGEDATKSRKGNFLKYRLSPIVSGGVYTAYLYYVVQMIFQTEEEQQSTASNNEFPASWTSSVVGSVFVGIFGLAFFIALITQLVNAITGNFISDLKSSAPDARRWEAIIVHTSGRIGFAARGVVFGTLSGFLWESLAKRNVSGHSSVVGAAINKLADRAGGKFFLMVIAIGLIIYAIFAIANAYYKYFPTPPPSRIPLYVVEDEGPAWWSKIRRFRKCKAREEKEKEAKHEKQRRQHSIKQYLRIPRALRPANNVPPPSSSTS